MYQVENPLDTIYKEQVALVKDTGNFQLNESERVDRTGLFWVPLIEGGFYSGKVLQHVNKLVRLETVYFEFSQLNLTAPQLIEIAYNAEAAYAAGARYNRLLPAAIELGYLPAEVSDDQVLRRAINKAKYYLGASLERNYEGMQIEKPNLKYQQTAIDVLELEKNLSSLTPFLNSCEWDTQSSLQEVMVENPHLRWFLDFLSAGGSPIELSNELRISMSSTQWGELRGRILYTFLPGYEWEGRTGLEFVRRIPLALFNQFGTDWQGRSVDQVLANYAHAKETVKYLSESEWKGVWSLRLFFNQIEPHLHEISESANSRRIVEPKYASEYQPSMLDYRFIKRIPQGLQWLISTFMEGESGRLRAQKDIREYMSYCIGVDLSESAVSDAYNGVIKLLENVLLLNCETHSKDFVAQIMQKRMRKMNSAMDLLTRLYRGEEV